MAAESLFSHRAGSAANRAKLTLHPETRSPHRVNPYLYGKFCEHLGFNIYQGMEAQILLNPTFSAWNFSGDRGRFNMTDGGMVQACRDDHIALRARSYARRVGLHAAERLLRDYADGAAFGWTRVGDFDEVRVSPDVGPHGGRAQRLETPGATPAEPLGLAHGAYLPLHRTRGYRFRLVARAIDPTQVTLSLTALIEEGAAPEPLASATVELDTQWRTVEGELTIPAAAEIDAEGRYRVSITTDEPANVVIDRLLLYPDDHVNGADPDVIDMLRESGLPLLRWPGGNFVSGYHWRDGVGPIDARPALPNPAWEGLEFNFFGTDEFMAFCQAVGCEPMICVNAGDATPQEAADWVEYCNGASDTPMGKLRAENGHPEPYGVRLWEIGNELYGRWQVSWTTPQGYVDRYNRFVAAMQSVDDSSEILANGSPEGGVEDEWNRTLIDAGGAGVRCITDHLLTGGSVGPETDPAELFHSFMGYATTLAPRYQAMCQRMAEQGVEGAQMAITELQLFAHFGSLPVPGGSLSPETLPTPATISEALYDATLIHECIRMGDMMKLLTHSATLNHGGGLRKVRERVWANPCHYGHSMGLALAGGTPIGVTLECDTFSTNHSFGRTPAHRDVPVLDAMAVLDEDEEALLLMLVHRSATVGDVSLDINLGGLATGEEAELLTLSGETMYDQNTLDDPERIVPQASTVPMTDGRLSLTLRPYSLTRVRVTLG